MTIIEGKLKINKESLKEYLYVFLFISYVPTFITRIIDIPYWGYLCYGIIFSACVYFIYRIHRITMPMIVSGIFYLYYIIPTILNDSEYLFECLLRAFTGITFAIMLEYLFRTHNKKQVISILLKVFEVFNYVNLLFMLIYPNGMYKVITDGINEEVVRVLPGEIRSQSRVFWPLGHQTLLLQYTLPSFLLIALYSQINKKGNFKNIRSVFLLIAILLETYIAQSAGNYVAIVLFLGFVLLFKMRIRINLLFVFFGVIIIYITLIYVSNDSTIYIFLSQLTGRDVKISTRLPIWWKTLYYSMQKPLLGWGYLKDGSQEIRQMLTLGNPHSTYFWALFEGGVVGVSLLLAYFTFWGKNINKSFKKNEVIYTFSAFITLLICMVDDDHIFRSPLYLVIFFLLYYSIRGYKLKEHSSKTGGLS